MRLSIVIPSYNSAPTIEACLQALVPQCDASTEILVVDSGDDDVAARVTSRFPGVVLIRSPERLYPGGARNLGVNRARGDVIAFVDADCLAAPDWVTRIKAAHAHDRVAVGGVVAIEAPRGPLDWAAYFCSFHGWLPGTPAGTMRDIPTCSLSFRHLVLDDHRPFLNEGFSSDTEFNWRLARSGVLLHLDPLIRVGHIHHPTWTSFVKRQWTRGRAFAGVRAKAQDFSPGRRAVYAPGLVALPLLLTFRLARRLASPAAPPAYRAAFLASMPLVLLGFTIWSLGEAAGYLRPD